MINVNRLNKCHVTYSGTENKSYSVLKNNLKPYDLIIYGQIYQNIMTVSKSMAYAIIPIFVIALATGFTIIPSAFDAYAITGGDSGVGLKPTLGIDNRGYRLIEDGLTINGQTFMAEYFS